MSSPFYTVLLFKGSKMTAHIHMQHCSVLCVWGNKNRTSRFKFVKKKKKKKLLPRWLERRVRLGKHPIKVPLEGTHWIKPKVLHIGLLHLWILLLLFYVCLPKSSASSVLLTDPGKQSVGSGDAKLDVVVNLQRGGDRVAQHFRGYSWRFNFLSLKYPNAWAVRVSGENGEL